MKQVMFYENKQKVRAGALRYTAVGAAVIALAVLAYLFLNTLLPDMGAYMAAGIRGGVTAVFGAVGLMALIIGISWFAKLGKKPEPVIAANEEGVAIAFARNEPLFIPWEEVEGIRTIYKGKQQCVGFMLHNAPAYTNEIHRNHLGMAKSYMRVYGTPAVAFVDMCDIPKEQIAAELEKVRKNIQ